MVPLLSVLFVPLWASGFIAGTSRPCATSLAFTSVCATALFTASRNFASTGAGVCEGRPPLSFFVALPHAGVEDFTVILDDSDFYAQPISVGQALPLHWAPSDAIVLGRLDS